MSATPQRVQPDTLARLDRLIGKVPPQINGGGYMLTVRFRASMVKAIKTRHKRSLSEADAAATCRELEHYKELP